MQTLHEGTLCRFATYRVGRHEEDAIGIYLDDPATSLTDGPYDLP